MHEKVIKEIKDNKIKILDKKEALYPYAFDTAPTETKVIIPAMVAYPKNSNDVSNIVKTASKYGYNVIARGAGTCHTSGCKPNEKSIVIHFSLMDKIIEINKENLTAKVQPNVAVGKLQQEVEKLKLFFPPDPSNLLVSTIGGAAALSSGGPRTFKYGSTKDYIINLTVVLANGEIMKTAPDVAKNATGYNLTQLFTGSEGTLGIITEITVRLIPKPEKRIVTLAYFDKLTDATKGVNNIINALITPSTLDLLDKNTLKTIEKYNPAGLLTDKEAALLIETDGSEIQVVQEKEKIKKLLLESGASEIRQANNDIENEQIWRARRSAYACVTKLKPNVMTEDVVVPRENIVPLVKGIENLCKQYSITVCTMGHAGDGNIHPNFALDLKNKEEYKNFQIVKDKLFELAVNLGGTLSGEHGIGSEKKKYLPMAIDSVALKYMEKIKKLFDPNNVINPNKMF